MRLLFAIVVICISLSGSAVFAVVCDYNSCTYATAQVGVTEITFNSSGYFPSCIRVDVGDNVTFTGPFATYALTSGYLNGATEVAVDNDISNVTTGTTKSFNMSTSGVSAFFSPGSSDVLKGAIYVGTTCDPTPPVTAPVTPPTTVAPVSPPTAAPTAAPTSAPVTPPTSAPSTSSPVAAPDNTPVDSSAPVDSTTPMTSPSASTPMNESPVAAPTSASAPRPLRVRVSSAAQVYSGLAVLAVAGVAML